MSAPAPPFSSRRTVLAATDMLKALGHSGFERFLLELGLPDENIGQGAGLMARANSLAKYAVDHPDAVTAEGRPLSAAIVAKAGELYRSNTQNNIGAQERDAFQQASAGDGAMSDVASPNWPDPAQSMTTPMPTAPWGQPPQSLPNQRVFIVHGHDLAMQQAVANFVRTIGLEPIILAEQVNGGKTVIEKFEKNADVGYAIILLSPDDLVGPSADARARQNVILEWGYFIGRLGRAHVCALKRGNVELPSDIIGFVWVSFDENGGWKRSIVKELLEAGLRIDESAALTA